ncbi:MAG TPA: chemotaxis protein CheA [Vicinamibacterales bacterium]|nr:chemotaxis protein CheA [Vicinamibacterales bacterium]
MESDFLDRFLNEYYAESEEHLAAIRRALLQLEDSIGQPRPNPSVTEELFRSFHSIKGISAMVEHREAELLAHEMESYLRALREGQSLLTTPGIEALIEGTRLLDDAIASHRAGRPQPDTTPARSALQALVSEHDATALVVNAAPIPDGPAWQCLFTPSPALLARGISVDVVRSRLREHGEILRAQPLIGEAGAISFEFLISGIPDEETRQSWSSDGMLCSPIELPRPDAAGITAAPRAADAESAASSAHFVRVDLSRLDDLMRMIGDLVILRARLVDALDAVEPHVPPAHWRGLQETTSGIERQLRELREGVMRVRLVPVGEIFRRMPFAVRDLARDTGRRVRVEMKGQDTQIDKFLVERMMDPALHLVRNAVAHGLEGAEERINSGKPPEGTLLLAASAAGEVATIEIADDGRGIDVERVAERARAAGLNVPAVLDHAALLDLICSPGFSTREDSDRASGRGFGMAVVRRTVQELGGSMRLWTEAGRGTRFTIELPLTLAITDALLARIGPQTFAVPQTAVREVIELDESSIRRVEDGEVAPYRGMALPIIRLSARLGLPSTHTGRLHAFIIGTGSAAVGLVVDRIVGQREIVVRSTVDPLIRVEGVAGATDLGDGRVVLILDAGAIARLVRQRGGPAAQAATA